MYGEKEYANLRKGFAPAAMLALLLGALLFGAPLSAQDESQPADRIDIDFVERNIHVVMHFIGLKSGLNISVEGEIDVKLTVIYKQVQPKAAIRSICESNELEYIENGNFIFIKKRPKTEEGLANVVEGSMSGRFSVNFEKHELVNAIMETAKVTNTNVFVPAHGFEETTYNSGTDWESTVIKIQTRKISMFMQEATPDEILHRLAILGNLDVKRENDGYHFSYKEKPTAGEVGGAGAQPVLPPDEIELESRNWTIPGIDVNRLATQVKNLVSPYGKVVFDETTGYIMVVDIEDYLERVIEFLDPVQEAVLDRAATAEETAEAAKDPFMVRSYSTMREVSDTEFQQGLSSVLTNEGKVTVNSDSNTIIVYDRTSQFPFIDEFILASDTLPEQVLMTAQLSEISLDEYMGYGLEIFTDHGAASLNDGRFTASGVDTTSGSVGGLFGQPTGFDPFFGTFVNPRVNVTLEALANEGRVETLSAPSIMVSNRKQAKITVGQEVPYLQSSSATGGTATTTVSFKEVAIVLEVTPLILGDGLIRLELKVTVKEQIGNVAIEGNNTPILSNREAESNIFIRDGETLVMGGLIRDRERTQENGIPFLKDIPILGYLFKSENIRHEKTDLLFFLRPQIVSAGSMESNRQGGKYGLERVVTPVLDSDDDAKRLALMDDDYEKNGRAEKPAWFNEQKRPKKAQDVNPGG